MEQTEIFVQDGYRYVYTTAFINAENPLGVVKATLKEYTVCKIAEAEMLIGKLYRTKEGNWYDMPGSTPINPLLRTMIKMAIDEAEKNNAIINNEAH